MTCTASFETGVNGASISTGDTGAATAWDGVSLGGAGSLLQYDNTHAAHGTLSGKSHNQTSGATNLLWQTAFGTQTEHWGRAYVYCTTYPGTTIITPVDSGSAVAGIEWNGSGTFTVNAVASGVAIPLSTWGRIEWHYFHNAAGFLVLRTYLSSDSTTADDIKLFSFDTGTSANEIDFGNRGAGGAVYTMWYDQLVGAADSFPGPFPVSSISPTVAGQSSVGSTLYCDGGTWNDGAQFTLSYQWTRNSVSIGGATSRTYVTTPSDAANPIGCVVTATGIVATNESASQASTNTITPAAVTGVSTFGPPQILGRR